MDEIWRPVPDFLGLYEVSDRGRVRSLRKAALPKRVRPRKTPKSPFLAPWKTHGYRHVELRSATGEGLKIKVGALVLRAFRGPCPTGLELCHNNGVRDDDRLENLRWDTRSANHADRITHGTDARGERSPTAKITASQAAEIRSSTAPQRALASRFGISQGQVSRIKSGVRWQHSLAA